MSNYVFELSDVSIANGDDTLHINNSDSVFGAIPGSMLWIDSYRPRFVQNVDNAARTVTLTENWNGSNVVNKSATIIPLSYQAEQQKAVDSVNNVTSAAQNLLIRFLGLEGEYQQFLTEKFLALSAAVDGLISFETLEQLNTAGSPTTQGIDNNSLVRVWNDSVQLNNGTYGWDGIAWVRSAYDYESRFSDVLAQISDTLASSNDFTRRLIERTGVNATEDATLNRLNDFGLLGDDDIVAAISDENGNAPLAISSVGRVLIRALRSMGIEIGADQVSLTAEVVNYDIVVVDEAGNPGAGLLYGEWYAGQLSDSEAGAVTSLPFDDGSQIEVGEFNYDYAVADENGNVLSGYLNGQHLIGTDPNVIPPDTLELAEAATIQAGEFNYTYAIADEEGNVLEGWLDGVFYGPSGSASGGGGTTLSTQDAENIAWSSSLTNQINAHAATPGYECNAFVFYGQSLMVGQEGWPVLSKNPVDGNFMLGECVRPETNDGATFPPHGDGQFHPLVEKVQSHQTLLDDAAVAALTPGDGSYGETVCSGTLNLARTLLAQRLMTLTLSNRDFVALNAAVSGRTIEQLSKNNTQDATYRYGRVIDGITRAKQLADNAGQTFGVPAIYWMQGEFNYADNGGSANYSDYLNLLEQLHSDLATDISALTGQTQAPSFFLYQTGATYTRDADEFGQPGLHVGMAQWDFSLNDVNRYLVGPVYPYTDKGGHLDANGYRWFGQMLGKVTHHVMTARQGWEPLSPRRIATNDDEVLIDFHVPCPPLQFKSPYVVNTAQDYASKGFKVTDDQGVIPILDVQIVGSTIIKISLSRAITTNAHVWYADKTSHQGNGCLCDSDPTTGLDVYEYLDGSGMYASANISALVDKPYPLENWCIAFYLPANWERI